MKREIAALILFVIFAVVIGIFAMYFVSNHYSTATVDVDLIEDTDSEELLADGGSDNGEPLNEADDIDEALNDGTDCDDPYAVGWAKAWALYYGCACPREVICIEEALHNDEVHCIDFLKTLSSDELYELYAPFARVSGIMNERYHDGHYSWMSTPCIHCPDWRDAMRTALSSRTLAEHKYLILANMRIGQPSEYRNAVHTAFIEADMNWFERLRIINLMSLYYPEMEQRISGYLEDGVCIGDVFKLITGRDAYEVYCSDVCCVV